MKVKFYAVAFFSILAQVSFGQISFDPKIDYTIVPDVVVVPPSPLIKQVLFIGGVDSVQTKGVYGHADSVTIAKQWHDFIGFTPDTEPGTQDLGWISVNHEMIVANDKIGDGGGMTVFKVRRDATTDSLIIVPQTLADGRSGKYFSVDFVNTVGETGMNCGGINSADGRIWTAEEWFRTNNASIITYNNVQGVRDTMDFTIQNSGIAMADGQTVRKYQNFNYMVEIDPREAKAIRKQYNWGRQEFEGGVVMPDNKTVYLGVDATPAFFSKFVASTAGDFTSGTLYVYKQGAQNPWVEMETGNISNVLNFAQQAIDSGATMFNRNEWVAFDQESGMVYMTETGRDNPGSAWKNAHLAGCDFAQHHQDRAYQQNVTADSTAYKDYYGRVLKFNPVTNEMTVFLEGGPDLYNGASISNYPSVHLSNPDGLTVMTVNNQSYLVICEDLNGTSGGRVPNGISNSECELFLLDLSISNPNWDDLVRIAQVPVGAEVTGVRATPDGKTLMFNCQHPSTGNPFPYNNSVTIALTGWDKADVAGLDDIQKNEQSFEMYPNPTSRIVYFSQTVDAAIYNAQGQLMQVLRNTDHLNVENLQTGTYFVKTSTGAVKKLIVQ